MRLTGTVALCVFVAAGSGCAAYTRVDRGVHDLGSYTIETPIEWNKRSGKPTVWTVHGVGLDYLLHFNAVKSGKKMFPRTPREMGRPFVATMRETEVVDLFVENLAMRGTQAVRLLQLQPASFGPWRGFSFDLEFESVGGLPMRGTGTGAIIADELHLLFYAGAREHYFDRHRADVQAILASIAR
ncbi:MAG: hypothetical protein OXU77_10985 [Gammaproteobacteria bacterium]|nr:hypothetical protein [Gammaproteobacteria bacterium]